ncbi:MAG: serine kinase [Deltaproteobacteria bacterium]|nr:serine kinase [Deltaproteobacteria bacterium]
MKISALVEALGLTVHCGNDQLDREVTGGYVGDLLSDVIANSRGGDVWITRQGHQNIVAVAVLKEHACVILTLGQEPEKDTLDKASKEGIPILVTNQNGFVTAGKIYHLLGK